MSKLFKIKAKTAYNGTGYGLIFTNGEAQTENERIARMLKDVGYEVTEISKPADPAQPPAPPSADAATVTPPTQPTSGGIGSGTGTPS